MVYKPGVLAEHLRCAVRTSSLLVRIRRHLPKAIIKIPPTADQHQSVDNSGARLSLPAKGVFASMYLLIKKDAVAVQQVGWQYRGFLCNKGYDDGQWCVPGQCHPC